MRTVQWLRAVVLGVGALFALAPAVLGDTCCANTVVNLEPATASPGERVTATGLRCLRSDNTGPVAYTPARFYFWAGTRPGEGQPDTAPGPGLPQDLPRVETWPAFDSATETSGGIGTAVLKVPDLRNGSYQLWWWCDDGSGPGGGIHYSYGTRLTVTGAPETDAAAPVPTSDPADGGPAALVVVGIAAAAVTLLHIRDRRTSTRPNA